MAKKAKLDKSRSFAVISSLDPKSPCYEQDGIFFGSDELECGKTEGYDKKKQAEADKAAAAEQAEKDAADAAAAKEILGDLDDPNAEAARENAAAEAAEKAAEE